MPQRVSNSQRLRELAEESGIHGHLIDGPEDIEAAWFDPDDTVLVTAGASAPESVVEDCLDHLRREYGAIVELKVIRQEEVHFPLPRELRQLQDN